MRPDPPADDPDDGLPPSLPVPDDASGLERDAEALRRERRALARRDLLVRLARGRGRAGVGAPLVLAVLLLVGLVAALPVVLRPSLSDDPPPAPLAAPSVAPGTVGGLLPDVVLRAPDGPLPARDTARPGVVVLVPVACRCDEAVAQAVLQSRQFTRNIRLVVDGRGEGAGGEAARLRRGPGRGLVTSAVDPGGALAAAYRSRGATLVVLADDGVVLDVLVDVRAGQRLEARLSVLRGLQGLGAPHHARPSPATPPR